MDLREIRAHAIDLAEEFKLKKLEVEDHLDELQARNIIEIKSLKEIGIHGVSLKELEPLLQKQIKRGGGGNKNDY